MKSARKARKLEVAKEIMNLSKFPCPPGLTAQMVAESHSLPEMERELARMKEVSK